MAFHTRRITLRTPTAADDGPLVSLFTDPKTMRHLPHLHNQAWDEPRMAARREARHDDERRGRARNFTIVLRDQRRAVVGQAGYRTLTQAEKRGELGVVVAHSQQGRGLVWDVHLLLLTLGFEELGLEVVEWVTAAENDAMRAVLRKMGCKDAGPLEGEADDVGSQVKYTLEQKDWADCKVSLSARVDRLAAAASQGL